MSDKTELNIMYDCLELAKKGFPHTSPNPLVGCIIVKDGKIIAKGFHERYGAAHAEVNAIKNAQQELSGATLYVNLEPCSHFGKTPPCVNAILESGIKKVVIGTIDPNPKVSGRGIERLREAKIEVIVGVLEKECRELNKRFFTFHEKKRPYVILKWAQSSDGFISETGKKTSISELKAQKLSHKWRSEEQAIVVGTNTALIDNPELTVRLVDGKNPLRVIFDRDLIIPKSNKIFNDQAETLVISKYSDSILEMFKILHERKISSCIVEGGAKLLNSFLARGLWDEARVFIAPIKIGNGVEAPKISIKDYETIGPDKLFRTYRELFL